MHKFYTPWCSLLQHLLEREKLSQYRFAELIGSQQQSIGAYLVGRTKPPLEDLKIWGDVLHLSQEERESFMWLALETYTPTVVWEKVQKLAEILADTEGHLSELEGEIARLRTQVDSFQSNSLGAAEQL